MKLVLKEWQFSDGSQSSNNFHVQSRQSLFGSSSFESRTGRKIHVTVVEGKDLSVKDKSGKCDPYVKLQYGKVGFLFLRKRPLINDSRPYRHFKRIVLTPHMFWKHLFRFFRKQGLLMVRILSGIRSLNLMR